MKVYQPIVKNKAQFRVSKVMTYVILKVDCLRDNLINYNARKTPDLISL